MIKATLVFGLYSDTYQKTDYGWNSQLSAKGLQDAKDVLSDVIAENYPNANFHVDYIIGTEWDLSEYNPEHLPLTRYTVTMFDPDLDKSWSMKNVASIEQQLNESFRNRFMYAFGEVDLDFPDGVWCKICTKVGNKDCTACKGEMVITYESMLDV
jgi:hypothetical protein